MNDSIFFTLVFILFFTLVSVVGFFIAPKAERKEIIANVKSYFGKKC
jgi:hypothetical protein